MQLAVNRSGAALDTAIATPTGWVQMQLLNNETRLRGYARADLAGVTSKATSS